MNKIQFKKLKREKQFYQLIFSEDTIYLHHKK